MSVSIVSIKCDFLIAGCLFILLAIAPADISPDIGETQELEFRNSQHSHLHMIQHHIGHDYGVPEARQEDILYINSLNHYSNPMRSIISLAF